MKILELHLTAYGPFTDHKLDFSAGSLGLHFIYGPNEAGKSSALRALQHALYGIPQRCPDSFLHPYNKMRIGAKICSQNGESLAFLRRKGRSNTLRTMDDKTIIKAVQLDRFLNGVDVDQFTTLFGIDYMELTRGGAEIISGGGSLGKLLFSAGSGIADLGQIQKELQDQADGLFKRAAQKPTINATLSKIDATQKALREAQLPGQKWIAHDQALQDAQVRMQEIDQLLRQHRRQLHRLERIKAALPLITRRKELQDDLETVTDAVLLPSDFSAKRQKWTTDLKVAVSSHEQLRQRQTQLSREFAQQQVPNEILNAADEIDAFYREVGSLQKAAKDRLQLQTRYSTLMAEAKDILKKLQRDLPMDAVETLRIQKVDVVAIQELRDTYENLRARRSSIQDARLRWERLLTESEKHIEGLNQPRSTKILKDALDQAEEHVTQESFYREEKAKVSLAMETLKTRIAKLGLWNGALEKLEKLAIPPTESISIFETRLQGLYRKEEELTARSENLALEKEDVISQIRTLQLERRIPTPTHLDDARRIREEGWHFLRLKLKNRALNELKVRQYLSTFSQVTSLIKAYESAVQNADQVADRLRHEAESVAVLAKLFSEEKSISIQLEYVQKELTSVQAALVAALRDWADLWKPIDIAPLSPTEMRTWVQNQKRLAEKATELRERKAKVDQLEAGIFQQCRILDTCLTDFGETDQVPCETLLARIKRIRRIIESEDALYAVRDRHEAEKNHRREELSIVRSKERQTEAELSHWKIQWGLAMQRLGLDDTALPRQANAVIEENKKLFDTLKEAHILHQRMQGIDRDETTFAENIKRLVHQIAPDLIQLSSQQAVMTLNQRLSHARVTRSDHQKQAKELKHLQKRCDQSARDVTATKARLDLLCQQAGCSDYEALPAAELRSEKRSRMEVELSRVDKELRKLSAGTDIATFITEALEPDPDSISGEMAALKNAIDVLDTEKEEINQTIGRERNELSKMNGSARAAEMAEEIQLLMGRLQNDTEQYARLRLASVILKNAMERFRDKNQGPLLTNASRIFAKLTGGSFKGIRADYDDYGEPVLVGIRPNSKEIVAVQGMSAGSVDQLYLSLRLAGLLDYMERSEPMPFIVDDILIQFDDERASAALQALADLSCKTQVIFFTHHQHLFDLARKALPEEVLIPHLL